MSEQLAEVWVLGKSCLGPDEFVQIKQGKKWTEFLKVWIFFAKDFALGLRVGSALGETVAALMIPVPCLSECMHRVEGI